MHLEGAILRHRVSMGRIQISTLSSSSCLAIWTVTQHDKRRGNVEATSLSYDIRRLRLRTYGGGCDGGGGSFERLGPSNPNGSLMDTVMVSWRFTVSYVRHWIKSSQKVKHVEAYPPTPPTARGSASEKTLQPANDCKIQREGSRRIGFWCGEGNVLDAWKLHLGYIVCCAQCRCKMVMCIHGRALHLFWDWLRVGTLHPVWTLAYDSRT